MVVVVGAKATGEYEIVGGSPPAGLAVDVEFAGVGFVGAVGCPATEALAEILGVGEGADAATGEIGCVGGGGASGDGAWVVGGAVVPMIEGVVA